MEADGPPAEVLARYQKVIMAQEAAYAQAELVREKPQPTAEEIDAPQFTYRHGNGSAEILKVELLDASHEPAAIVLSRQALPTIDRTKYAAASGVARGAYVLADDPNGKPEVILLASGSEVSLCLQAFEQLKTEGINARVVSMPSWELFEHQSQAYRASVLPPDITARVAVEQATTFGWERYVGWTGSIIGMKTFGASAPLKELQQKFGFTAANVVDAAKEQLARKK